MAIKTKIILEGIVGSHAYGLATPESDIDYRGSFIEPTKSVLGIFGYQQTIDRNDPDICLHEVGKFIKLLRECNPNILEMLYLPTESYTTLTWEGKMLIFHRNDFLSNRVADTYGGYAISQIQRLLNRSDGSFSSQTRKRYQKHARHCIRLIDQGRQLLETGTLTVKVDDPEYLFEVGKLPPEKLSKVFEAKFAKYKSAVSVLPDKPNDKLINDLLIRFRMGNWS